MKSVGTIYVTLTPILSYKENAHPKGKKKELSLIEEVSEEAIKGDVRSHVIRYVRIADAVQEMLKPIGSHRVM